MNNTQTGKIAIFVMLAALMAATREYHFGTTLHLPDASLAVFLLAGFYLPRWAFPVLLVEAGLVDYLALNYGGVDGWCFSPAYWFLIPTYFVLWFAGRFYAKRYWAQHHRLSLRSLSEFAAIAFAATGAAFLISNASFYLLADYFANMSAVDYGGRVAQYFLPYLQSAFLYLIPAALLHIAAEQATRGSAQA
jgi:hypothetical protein